MTQTQTIQREASSDSTLTDKPSPPVAREGWGIIATAIIFAIGIGWISVYKLGDWGWVIAALGGLLVLFCIWFFRDPQRAIPGDPAMLVSPADGVVLAVEPWQPPEELGLGDVGPMQRIVIFLNVFNVHVNRVPIAGTVLSVARKDGGFAHAGKAGANHNKRCSIAIKCASGRIAVVTALTGWIARRIVCHAEQGDTFDKGDRFGVIRFGSRTDLYLPADALVLVKVGDKTLGGTTPVARW